MKFIDLGRQYEILKDNIDSNINKVVNSQQFIMGPEVEQLEEALAKFTGRKYCLTCGSGTEALQIPLMSYNLKKSDAVFVPSFTFFASAESVNLAGGTPVFVDIDKSFNMDPVSLEEQIKKVVEEGKLDPKGIVVVDLFGRSANYDAIEPIAHKYNLFILEDAAQGFGGSLHGKRNGAFGDVSATSFFPAKPLGCYGDGGAIFTDDEKMYNLMHSIRVHGQGSDKYDNVRMGINGRMDTMQAAVVLAKLTVFEDELRLRQQVADWYDEELKGYFITPERDKEYFSAWAQYTILAKDSKQREYIINKLKEKDIPIMIYYPIPLHEQTAYKNSEYSNVKLEHCSSIAKRVMSLPMYPYLKHEEVIMICDALKDAIKSSQ